MGGYGYPGAKNGLITNRPTCGGDKKAGLPPRIGVPIGIIMTTPVKSNANCCNTGLSCNAKYVSKSTNPAQSVIRRLRG